MNLIYYIIIAFILDLIIGDPEYKLHPVRLIGKQIYFFEKRFRKISINQNINGSLFFIFILGLIVFEISIIFVIVKIIDIIIEITLFTHVVSIFFIYSSICLKDLKQKGMEIYINLKENDFIGARKKLSMIVGRDTADLDKIQIIRAVVETLSENIVDGVVSPLFYALIGGPVLAMIYRTVNTLDSMVGYKNDKYLHFGKASAVTDDIFNYIPARLTGIFIPFSGLFCFNNMLRSFRIMFRDGQKHPSPNSAISESAVAGALGIQLGGTSYYLGVKSEKPVIGDKIYELNESHIKNTAGIAYLTSIIFLILGILIRYLIIKIFT